MTQYIYTLPPYSFDSALFLADTGVHRSFLKPFKMCIVVFRMGKMELTVREGCYYEDVCKRALDSK